MSVTVPERRLIALLADGGRFDLAVPIDDTLGDALRDRGFAMEAGRHVLLGRGGVETQLGTPARDLVDGDLYSIVDLSASLLAPSVSSASLPASRGSAALWWMLGTLAIVVSGADLLGGSASAFGSPGERVLMALGLASGAVLSAVFWAMRQKRDSAADAVTMLAPLGLAFSAGLVAIPLSLAEGAHLAVASGFLGAGVVAALLTATVGGLRLRSAAGTTTMLLLGLAAIWGLTLALGWGAPVAAAISAGAAPLALRALPSTLVNVPEGYHIDYTRFMSNRWSVRGAIPVSPRSIRMDTVRSIVDESSARLVAGTVLISLLPVTMVPVVLASGWRADPVVVAGTIGLLATIVVAFLLVPRHSTTPLLRWAPRAVVAIVALETAGALATSFGQLPLVAAAGGLLAIAVIVAITVVPVGRGASSLVWSRLADTVEWAAVALALPAGLLAANILTLMRGMMAG